MEISENELLSINGGGVKNSVWIIAGGLITIVVGIIDGFLRPLKCHK